MKLIDAARTAPNADDEEHRDQAALEEQIEQHEVEAREHADHQRLEHEEGDHIFRTRAVIDCQLARMQSGMSSVVRRTNGKEMPSTPM